MTKQLSIILERSIIAVLVFQLVGCGTLFYPERRGQKAGHLDVGIVVLDAIGLLFFLIPGIIAFAVDFSNGTIYLPAAIGPKVQLREIKFDPKRTDLAEIEKIIKDETGYAVKLRKNNVQVSRLNSQEDMMQHFAQNLPEVQNSRLASIPTREKFYD